MSCEGCESRWDGEVFFVDGKPGELRDVLSDLDVPESLHEEVHDTVRCPRCGSELAGWDRVGTQWPEEAAFENTVYKADRRWARKLDRFADFLSAAPMLGASHAVGKRILKEVAAFPKTTIPSGEWVRARRAEGARRFLSKDLRVPDPAKTPIPVGRFNHSGQAHWYLAADEDTALREVLGPGETLAWLQKWKLPKLRDVLDLVEFGPISPFDDPPPTDLERLPLLAVAMIFGGYLTRATSSHWKPEYFVPLFVMDAAKSAGFQSIRYSSAQTRGQDLVLLSRPRKMTALGDPVVATLDDLHRRSQDHEVEL